ncbi:acylamino-acid-releasing enzyme isoform X1 [Patella vulgata]|uniref:acylamino-acid-releasing enzyme isoform X1 n=2 Tax=Patella vulgata TaxID=6465 RepID=UPI0024A7D757|nr:acylamino-acid-releasing enzyme isoform X1 [Patella vulgata]
MAAKQMEEIVEIYRNLSSISQPTLARVRSNNDQFLAVYTEWTQRDLEKADKTNFTRNYVLNASDNSILLSTPAQEIKNELFNVESPSGKFQAILRSWTNKKGDEKQFIEIWNNDGKVKNFDILAKEKHGKINNKDVNFGSFQWSYSEQKLAYVAEKKKTKTGSYFDNKEDEKKDDIVKGHEHDVLEDWGEQLTKKSQPIVCILDISTGSVDVLETAENVSCGEVLWCPNDSGVVFVGWDHEPFRLGLKYCTQRKSGVYYYDFESKKTVLLSDEGRAVHALSISPDQSKLVYMDQPIGGGHKQCSRLMMVDWKTKTSQAVIDIVNTIKAGGDFCGMYFDAFPVRCWSTDSTYVFIDTNRRSQVGAFGINVVNKTVHPISAGSHRGSVNVLDVYKDKIILSCSSPNTPHFLMIGNLNSKNIDESIKWNKLSEEVALPNISYDLTVLQPTVDRVNTNYGNLDCESILISNKENSISKPPLILFPHGGPHTTFDTSFMLYVAGFCQSGYSVLLVNYRGSLGFGQNSVNSLLGNIGDQDVKDVKAALDDVIQRGLVDGDQVFVFGGSHGGFLTTHLIGQYPGFFKAACCRNPVTNLTAMLNTSDIPDWVWEECGIKYCHSSVINAKTLEEMFNRSPIRYVDQVKTPLLLMIGKDDLRVPPTQAREYYRALKSRQIPTRLIEYEDNSHPITKVDSEADAFVNIVLWYNKYRT